ATLDEQLQKSELHRGELDRCLADAKHATVDALAQVELVAARRRDLGAEHQLVATGRGSATRATRWLNFGQRIRPKVEFYIAESNRRAAGQIVLGAPGAFDFGAIAAGIVDNVPASIHQLHDGVLTRYRCVQHRDIDTRIATDATAVGDRVSNT